MRKPAGSRRVSRARCIATSAIRAAAGNSGFERRLTSAPEIGWCIILSWAPVKTGARGCRRYGQKRALGACSPSAPNPWRIFGFFLCEQKETRRKAKPCSGKPGRLFLPFLLAPSKEMGSGKNDFQGRQPLVLVSLCASKKKLAARRKLAGARGPARASMDGKGPSPCQIGRDGLHRPAFLEGVVFR